MNIVSWCGFTFHVKNDEIIAAKDIKISVSVETENKSANGENYTTKKNLNPSEISMTGIFSAALGVQNVQAAALELVNLCRSASEGYVYFGDAKLMPPMFMGTGANITNIQIGANNAWLYCEVPITLKQSEKYSGGTTGSKKKKKSKKKKASARNGNGNTTDPKEVAELIKGAVSAVKAAVNKVSLKDKYAKNYSTKGTVKFTVPGKKDRRISGITK